MSWNPEVAYNDLPTLPPQNFDESKAILRQTTKSRVALESLRQAVNLIPNNEILIQTIPILEAKGSSEIENIVTTTDELFKYIDADDNAKLYRDYNDYRRDTTANRDIQHHYQYFKLEVEQLVFYKIIRDYINGKWVIVVRDHSTK